MDNRSRMSPTPGFPNVATERLLSLLLLDCSGSPLGLIAGRMGEPGVVVGHRLAAEGADPSGAELVPVVRIAGHL